MSEENKTVFVVRNKHGEHIGSGDTWNVAWKNALGKWETGKLGESIERREKNGCTCLEYMLVL